MAKMVKCDSAAADCRRYRGGCCGARLIHHPNKDGWGNLCTKWHECDFRLKKVRCVAVKPKERK